MSKKLLLCPDCSKLIDFPILCIFDQYSCYRCKKKITTGTWIIFPLENDKCFSSFGIWTFEPYLPNEAREMMFKSGINLKFSYSATLDMNYWMQICPHCEAQQGDHYINEYLIEAVYNRNLMKQKKADFLYCMSCQKIITEKASVIASCVVCGKIVSEKVINYCLERPDTFKGNIYCYKCQRK